MLALRVKINDGKIVTGGAADLGVLTATVTAAGVLGPGARHPRPDEAPELVLSLRGLTSRADPGVDEHLAWIRQHELKVGDRVTIELVETADADDPVARRPTEQDDPPGPRS